MANSDPTRQEIRELIQLPASTAYPFILAAGIALILAALVMHVMLAYMGLIVSLYAAIGWFRQLLPYEQHHAIQALAEEVTVTRSTAQVARIQVDETHRAQLPLKTYPVSSGILGGLAGAVAMIIPAEIYGLARFHSLWYTINLLGGMGVFGTRNPSTQELTQFHLSVFLIAFAIHLTTSVLVGLLYGALLPVWPKHPIILGGIIAPALWTGGLHSILSIVNPFFNARISWPWFAASQLLFGLVAGVTVTRRGRIKTLAQMPLSVRLGLQTPGLRGNDVGQKPGDRGPGKQDGAQ
jgi:hypothetical protein